MPNYTEQARQAINEIRSYLKNAPPGVSHIDVRAGDLAEALGIPAKNVKSVADALYEKMNSKDQVIEEPPSGLGANLTIRFR